MAREPGTCIEVIATPGRSALTTVLSVKMVSRRMDEHARTRASSRVRHPGQTTLADPPGVHFPPEASRNFSRDFSAWNYPFPHFRDTPAYLQFFDAVEQLANEIAGRLDDVPDWSEQFPIMRPEPTLAESARLERLT
jgi:hypothetical protein